MKGLKKIIIRTFVIVAVAAIAIFAMRSYNDYRYKDSSDSSSPAYYQDVTDISLYPKEIEGVELIYLDERSLQGFRMTPIKKLYPGVVVCFGGSEGSPNFETAQRLAQEGYETLALFMFGRDHQPKTLARIPLEQFEDVLDYLQKNITDGGPISVIGASKGAEYALNLADKYPEISNLILLAPSSYNFAGLDFQDYGSSWTYQGQELPYIDIKKGSFTAFIGNMIYPLVVKSPVRYKETYTSAIEADVSRQQKMIPMKDIQANLLLIAGEADELWDSAKMAREIKEQKPDTQIHLYKEAGHLFSGNGILTTLSMRIATGGSTTGNQKAQEKSEKVIDDFLRIHHTP